MKIVTRTLAILLTAATSILLIQWLVQKLHRRWSGGGYIALYDDDYYSSYNHYSQVPHEHVSGVQRRFRG